MIPTSLVFMAHPVAPYRRKIDTGSDVASRRYWGERTHILTITTAKNLARAKRWLRALQDAFPTTAIIAPWITVCEIYDDANPDDRAENLLRGCYVLGRCDAIVLVGGRISNGMRIEMDHAILAGLNVYDLTHLGMDPPNETLLRATVQI